MSYIVRMNRLMGIDVTEITYSRVSELVHDNSYPVAMPLGQNSSMRVGWLKRETLVLITCSLHERRLPSPEEATYDGQWYAPRLRLGRL